MFARAINSLDRNWRRHLVWVIAAMGCLTVLWHIGPTIEAIAVGVLVVWSFFGG